MIHEAIKKIVEKKDLNFEESKTSVNEIMSGNVSPVLISAFLIALRTKGETIDEIAGAATAMRNAATQILHSKKHTIDTCGTGGDSSGTFNVSTAAAFIIAGAGYPVAKHGNKSVSSRCGSADVLQALGVNIQIPPEKISQCLDSVGIGFLFAPLLHSAMKYAMPVRKELGLRTIFNILGPLTNPAGVSSQLMGVYDKGLVSKIANVLKRIGIKYAMVVHGNGMDEITNTGVTYACMVEKDSIKELEIKPKDFNLLTAKKEDISGGDSKENAEHIRNLFKGKKDRRRDIALMNAAAGILLASLTAEDSRAKDLTAAFSIAQESIDSGAAFQKLEELIKCSNN